MNRSSAPRSIDDYLRQLRAALEGEDPSLIQDALYDAEEYLRAEVAAHPANPRRMCWNSSRVPTEHPTKSRPRTETQRSRSKPRCARPRRGALKTQVVRGVSSASFSTHARTRRSSILLLTLATGVMYFVLVVVGVSLSAGLAILIIGVPFFLVFISITRVVSLGEGRLIEAITGERMPRRPVHPGPPAGWGARIGAMLSDARTWTTLLYFVLMLPLGIFYFVVAVVGLSIGVNLVLAPFAVLGQTFGWIGADGRGFRSPSVLT